MKLTNRSHFPGPDLGARDDVRLGKQHEVIRDRMLDGMWRSLSEIERITGYPQASISSQLRHLRKLKYGSYAVERRRRAGCDGLYEYRVSPPVFGEDGQGAFQLGVG